MWKFHTRSFTVIAVHAIPEPQIRIDEAFALEIIHGRHRNQIMIMMNCLGSEKLVPPSQRGGKIDGRHVEALTALRS